MSGPLHGLGHDLRDALRGISKTPGFSAVVIVTLALGIGANVAIFTIFDQVLLRRLPVERPEELVLLDDPGPFIGFTVDAHSLSYPMYRDLRDGNEVFAGMLARFPTRLTLVHGGEAEYVRGELVSGNYFDVVGVVPAVGRPFGAEDDRTPGAHPVAILGHGFWQRRFGGDPLILNQTIAINGHPITVVGIAPPGFHGLGLDGATDVFVPILMKARMTPTWDHLENRRGRWVNVFARLAPGVDAESAEAALQPLYRSLLEEEVKNIPEGSESFRERFVAKRLELLPGTQGMPEVREATGGALSVLMGMVALVLLIACANVAGLLLARAQARQRDVAVRAALGAGRARLVRQRMAESLIYALAGGGLGVLLAFWGGELLLELMPRAGGAPALTTVPDLRVLAFAAGVAVATALIFGLAPALQGSRPALAPALREGSAGTGSGVRQVRLRRGVVTVQVALSAVLLAAALLFGRTLYNLRGVDPGFEIDRVVSFSIDPSLSGYQGARTRALLERLREEIGGLPGVRSVSLGTSPLLSNSVAQATVVVQGYQAAEDEDLNPAVDLVGPGYFSTLGIPLIAGREPAAADADGAPRIAVINQSMARYFFGDENPIGRRFGFGIDESAPIEIVGLVPDFHSAELRGTVGRALWLSYLQETPELGEVGQMTYYVRHEPGAGDLAAALRGAVLRVDPSIPLDDLQTLQTQARESLYLERLAAVLSTLFGVLATSLAAVGLYGMMSYSVVRRTRELGIRIALGALRPRILWSVLREVAWVVGLGLVVGLPAAYALGRLAGSLLFGLSPTDPWVLAGTCLLLGAVALAAGSLPARRATRIDPMTALRSE